ncbi:hypothetical protein CHS0354_010106 [Potamilus streckersoni]|uniref:PH and SEC7 domain-containing protein 3 n=1 Tax=Potamilus streckersoni TaxID=2493646 RepID=A0AAE0RSE8_9BIVA|nr:hypothetical protein CHS0354_010106 [Potamilus streckersoni]
MVDRVTQSPSRIPLPMKSASGSHHGKLSPMGDRKGRGKENAESIVFENGLASKSINSQDSPNLSAEKFPMPQKIKQEQGFETYLMTGDKMIKTKSTQKLGKPDGSPKPLERHHSDSLDIETGTEQKVVTRSASSPEASINLSASNKVFENISKKDLDMNLLYMDYRLSAESGFVDQGLCSETGTLDQKSTLPADPSSISDLSEADSQDLINAMTGSQSSAVSSNISAISTPSDIKSEVSVRTLLREEMEPLLNEDSSSSIDISSPESSTGEITADGILERSMSDSGGMSPPARDESAKTLLGSKSAEKITVHKQSRGNGEQHLVRASKSHENYLQSGPEFTMVTIDIDDDVAYSLDQIPMSAEDTESAEEDTISSKVQMQDLPDKKQNKTNEREFMPGFISLDEPKIRKLSKGKDRKGAKHSEESWEVDGSVISSVRMPFEIMEIQHKGHVDVCDSELLQESSQHFTGSELTCDTCGDLESPWRHRDEISEDEFTSEVDFERNEDHDMFPIETSLDSLDDDVIAFDPESLLSPPRSKSVDRPSAQRLAKRLYNLDGFRKIDVSRHLCKKNDFSNLVAEEYLKFFDFTNDTLDVALRKFLKQFSLIGETQERERVLAHFSRHFMQNNPGSFNSEDACHTLVCAIMLLNTDLHNQTIGRKMTCAEFIENLAELNDGENFSKDILKNIYHAIKNEAIEWAPDEEFQEMENRPNELTPANPLPSFPQSVGKNPFLDVPDPNQTTEYKKGYVMRKCCAEPDGKKTPIGKRGWRMFYATLRDLILYLHKDEHGMKRASFVEGSHNAIRIHHCLASKAADYTKKQHVFRLQTSDWAEYLFQTSNSKELQEWIDTINYVAASLSAPSLPSGVGSQKRFQRPLLPSSYTRLNLQDQLKENESRIAALEVELHDHRTLPPEKGSKARIIQDYIDKENYLEHEMKRYKTYVYLLQSKIASHAELEPSLVETAIDEEGQRVTNMASKKPLHRRISDRTEFYMPTLSTLV